jgi:hypothetical protein
MSARIRLRVGTGILSPPPPLLQHDHPDHHHHALTPVVQLTELGEVRTRLAVEKDQLLQALRQQVRASNHLVLHTQSVHHLRRSTCKDTRNRQRINEI